MSRTEAESPRASPCGEAGTVNERQEREPRRSPPSHAAKPAGYPAPGPGRPSADDMIAPVDGFEEWFEVRRVSRAERPS